MPLLVPSAFALEIPCSARRAQQRDPTAYSHHQVRQEYSVPHLRGMILKTDLEARKRGFCELLHRLQLVTYGTLNPSVVIGDVAFFQKEAQDAVLSKSSAEFIQWCHNSLTEGAAGAHAFLRKADEPPQIHVTFNDKRRDGSDPCTALSLRSDAWRKHWTKHDSGRRAEQLATAFKQARDEAVNFQDVNGHSSFAAFAGCRCFGAP